MDSRLLWGTVEMLILEVLSRGDSYGYQISQMVNGSSGGYFDLKEGSLYPALHRMERGRHLSSYWTDTAEGRRRKYYRLTPKGKAALKARREEWGRFSSAVGGVLGASHALA
jgi:transcriptional regulator